jgi:hypothetical protein
MASSKDVFEPKVYATTSFAAGAFRGTGVTVTAVGLVRATFTAKVPAVSATSKQPSVTFTGRTG